MPNTCRLCQAFTASGFPCSADLGRPGHSTFSRDREICDACLSHDFIPARRLGVFEWASVAFGLPISLFTALGLVNWGYRPVLSSAVLSLIVFTAAGAVVSTIAVWLVFQTILIIGPRLTARSTPEEDAACAERLYYLALWAALTHRERFKRKMLKKAKAVGLEDARRLADPRLAS